MTKKKLRTRPNWEAILDYLVPYLLIGVGIFVIYNIIFGLYQ